MRIEIHEAHWIESRSNYSAHELAELSGLTGDELVALVEQGVLPVGDGGDSARVFEAQAVMLVRIARRLRDAFELDGPGLAVAVTLVRRVRILEAELARVRAGAE